MNLMELLIPPAFDEPSELSGARRAGRDARALPAQKALTAPAPSFPQALSLGVTSSTALTLHSSSWCAVS